MATNKSKSSKWIVLLIVVLLIAVISPFAISKINQMLQDAEYERIEEQHKKEVAQSIAEEEAFLKQAKGNIEFLGVPMGGKQDDFIKMLKKHHNEIFSTSPQTKTEDGKTKSLWEGDYRSLKNCEYELVSDAFQQVLYLNVRVKGIENNMDDLTSTYNELHKMYGEPYTKSVRNYKESARWIDDGGIIDIDIFTSLDEINIQIAGKTWKEEILRYDPVR